jgi:hypothetical protein
VHWDSRKGVLRGTNCGRQCSGAAPEPVRGAALRSYIRHHDVALRRAARARRAAVAAALDPALARKLAVLADAAKYDASCASSGSRGRRATTAHGLGSTEGMGICHSYTPDGRCVSLLKLLLTNHCVYDCLYCVNRRSSPTPRAAFTVDEVVRLTLAFYRRNYVEGLFLSSGIARSPDDTMERLVRVARTLRTAHDFQGYIHLKTIPHASPELVAEAGRWADRLSVNVELPTQPSLDRLAPEKQLVTIRRAMTTIRAGIDAARDGAPRTASARADAPRFAPAGRARSSSSAPTGPPTRRSSPPRRRSTRRTGCAASTTRRSARSPTRRARCRARRRRSCASTGSTRPTGWCASTASRPAS